MTWAKKFLKNSFRNLRKKSPQKPKLIIVVGPTASGKSGLGIFLALRLSSGQAQKQFGIQGAEIISADSRQIYRGMNLGTGKVKKDKRLSAEFYSNGIRHHLLDVANPRKDFSVAQYKKLGEKAIADIFRRGKIPIIVGGTGFYINALLGQDFPEVPPNRQLRSQFEKLTVEVLFQKLKDLDPRRANTIDAKNKRRLIRALEIVLATGKTVPKIESKLKYDVLWLGLNPKNLQERIKKRLGRRFQEGMVAEVAGLHKQGVSYRRLENFGLEYSWIAQYLQKDISEPVMKDGLLKAIFHYAKRQMTWFKRNRETRWIPSKLQALKLSSEFLKDSGDLR
ncbi:MAG: tRNA (adenosine(37)-N6)-dimethylallyltransferase MiaA [Candidatus Yanofskybacteria bacterium]|nr:tRNA (adenosine(37)-N6)-dimethylallyltransferase MiaA [Candidatus Yanofskybacteria bacterium]